MTEVQSVEGNVTSPLPHHLVVTDDLLLERMLPEDAEATYQLLQANKDFLNQSLPGIADDSLEEMQEHLAGAKERADAGLTVSYKILARGKYVGAVNFYEREGTTATMGYWLSQDAQGKGYITASAKRLIDFGFNEWGLNEIKLGIDKNNERSQNTAKKIGAMLVSETPDEQNELHWVITKHEQ